MSTTSTTAFIATLLVVFGLCHTANAQIFDLASGPPFTPENLINNVFLGDGVQVLDLQYEGVDAAVGFFNNAQEEIGIQRGIVMSTGRVTSAGAFVGIDAPGSAFASTGVGSTVGTDNDLLDITDNPNLNDIARYTITFIPTSDTLQFNYIFASEEYPDYTCSDFNDVFGFFISGPGINGDFENNAENIALIPGTDLPVTINNVNGGEVGFQGNILNCTPPNGSLDYSAFYNDNTNSTDFPVYNGFTTVLTAQAIVQPCSTYVMKIAIADVGDDGFDSGVFLEAKSFGTGSIQADALTISLDGSVAEGCAEAVLNFELPNPAETDFVIDYTVFGEAIEGVDYNELPDPLVIPAGDTAVSIILSAFQDDLVEGTETFFLDVQLDPCRRDTIQLLIQDNPLVPIDLGPDTTICAGDSIVLTGEVPIPLPEAPSFTTTVPVNIPDQGDFRDIIFSSEIQVNGVQPPILQPGVIQSVCIDSLEHRWIDDLDIFLVSPSGQFIELTTDNGGNGGNGLGMDQMIGTCFTPVDTTPITSVLPTDVPFTGNWKPEGLWSDLYGANSLTNGTWTLQLIDDQVNVGGTLFQWSITFNAVYDISYSWSPTTGLSCSDCPNPTATVDSMTTYVVTATDAYGCSISDTITVDVFPVLPAPELSCDVVTGNSITVSWPDVPGAAGYEVNVDSMGWMPTSAPNSHTVTGLSNLTEVHFQVRAAGECGGLIDTVSCTTINDCEEPVVTLNASADVSCFGGNDGSLSVTATGDDGPFEYSVQGMVNTTGQFDNLPAGVYNVGAMDTVGCVGILTVTISQPDSIEAVLVQEDVACAGSNTGSAAVDISGGVAPYGFSWSNMSTDSAQTSLSAGDYTLTVVDGNGCDFEYVFSISEPDSIEAQVAVDSASCNGFDNGSATISVSGGVEPYAYAYSGGVPMGATLEDLNAGTYTVSITDANNCLLEETFTVEEPAALNLLTDATAASCFGSMNGGASAIVSGGTAPYAYQWFDSFGLQVGITDTLSGLPADNYDISITDANGCTLAGNAVVAQPDSIQLTATTNAASCAGVSDGSATITTSGGTAPYTFSWDDSGAPTDTRNDLGLGNYTVSVTDANGCEQIISFPIDAPEAVQLDLSAEPTRCFDSTDGQASVIATGGTGNYSFLWSNGQNTSTATALPPGNASVTVTDENGCTAIDAIMINQAPVINLELSGTDPACFEGEDGSISATASGGALGFTYNWSSGSGASTAENLSAGTYTLTLTDNNNCVAVDSFTLGQPDALNSDLNTQTATCLPTPDGEANVEVSGGTSPYSFAWDDGQNTSTAQGLSAGTYIVTITDNNGCTLLDTAVVDAVPGLELMPSTTDASCNAGNDGQASVSVTGGDGNYTYSWSSGLPDQPAVNTLSAGEYTLTVTDGLGCTATVSLSIGEPSALQINLQVNNVGCSGGNDGNASATVNGGTPPYTYAWSNGADGTTVNGLSIGNYNLVVTDANGCTASSNFDVEEATPIFISSDVEAVDCFGGQTGSISLSVSGGLPPYSYQWPNGSSNPTINGLAAGEYIVTVTDAAGCEVTEELFVPQPDEALTASVVPIDVSCFGESDGRLLVSVDGGTLPYRYSIDGDFFSGSSTFLGLAADNYQVIVRDANGCTFQTDVATIGEPDPIEVDLGNNRSVPFGESLQFMPTITGGIPPLTYAWSPQDSSILSCLDCLSPTLNISFQTTIRLTVTDANSCTGEDLVTINAEKNRPVFVATGFSPNGDMRNDLLFVQAREGVQLEVLYFRIFDRWGELIFENKDFAPNLPEEGWDGHYRGKPLQPGVYIWHIGVLYPDGLEDSFSGQSTIIR
jgi:gliding motility-associated-like protein